MSPQNAIIVRDIFVGFSVRQESSGLVEMIASLFDIFQLDA